MIDEKLQAARANLCSRRPYLATALYAMAVIKEPSVYTMAVDKYWRLYYSPDALLKWSIEEIAGILYHEILHLLREHPMRLESLKPSKVANIAADMEINDDLEDEKIILPEGCVYPKTFSFRDKLTAEEYFEKLKDNAKTASVKTFAGAGDCGSCADGEQRKWEQPAPTSGEQGVSHAMGEILIKDIAKQISETQGDVPGHLKRWAGEKLLTPKVKWEKELAAHVRKALAITAGSEDYSYSRASRRSANNDDGIIFPAMTKHLPEIAVVVDTSGSMSQDDLNSVLAEVSGMIKKCCSKQGLTVLAVDAALNSSQKVFSAKNINLIGGGGTDMGLGIQEALKLKPRPHVIIVLTDGYTGWLEKPPVQIIVGLIGKGPKAPDWAKTITINID